VSSVQPVSCEQQGRIENSDEVNVRPMADFVAYHTADRMGYPASASGGFSFLTNKKTTSVLGSRVWQTIGEERYIRGLEVALREAQT